jgi:hypothetical protein
VVLLQHRISFFEELVTVRDSIVHTDAKTEWEFSGQKRRVADKYANAALGEVEFTPTHLQEAIEKSTKQVKWYDAQLDVINPPESDPGVVPRPHLEERENVRP